MLRIFCVQSVGSRSHYQAEEYCCDFSVMLCCWFGCAIQSSAGRITAIINSSYICISLYVIGAVLLIKKLNQWTDLKVSGLVPHPFVPVVTDEAVERARLMEPT